MKTVQEKIKSIDELLKRISAHCMCLELQETQTHFIVYFPEGFYIGGMQHSKDEGKERALSKLLNKIEEYWQQSYVTGG